MAFSSIHAVEAVRVGSGFTLPLFATAPAGDTNRLFVVEKKGAIKILNLATQTVNPTPFLTLSVNSIGERGLFGLAFHPDYATNGRFYTNATIDNRIEIREFTVSSNPDIASPKGKLLLSYKPTFDAHFGGWIGFGPNDGYLYIAVGDGGRWDDPRNNGQNKKTLLGKILRIDVDHDDYRRQRLNYAIPPDNPYARQAGVQREIWAYGLRNPWRCSFDRESGDFYITDVGQNLREEINFQPANSAGSENYGWRIREGLNDNPNVGGRTPADAVDPIHDYEHGDGTFNGNSITGGYVYRGNDIPELQGKYFFADFVSNRVWSLEYDGHTVTGLTSWTEILTPSEGNFTNISSFGEDGAGELYIISIWGDIFKIVP